MDRVGKGLRTGAGRARVGVAMLCAGLALTGCERLGLGGLGLSSFGGGSEIRFDGQRFRAVARPVERRDKQAFVVTVPGVSRSLQGAILAGDHAGKEHCVHYFGTSDIDWSVGPRTDPAALVIDGDTLRLAGRCRD